MSGKLTDETNFSDLIGDVNRLDHSRINVYQDQVKKKVSVKIKTNESEDFSNIDFQTLVKIDASFFHSSISMKRQKKIRQGSILIDGHLDLHGCNQQQATKGLFQFVEQAISVNFQFLIVVHGKGSRSEHQSVLKPLVHHWLAQQKMVLAWCPAQPKHGGSGASYVYLSQRISD
ncbi:MAG: DNA-nicking Smr family endonuclease [Candidatus Azotimanducaceae bacterium]|jgi:DNA-nicking Smr family endonuclease